MRFWVKGAIGFSISFAVGGWMQSRTAANVAARAGTYGKLTVSGGGR